MIDYSPMSMLKNIVERIEAGGDITPAEAVAVLKGGEREALHEAAHAVTEHFKPDHFDFCAIPSLPVE